MITTRFLLATEQTIKGEGERPTAYTQGKLTRNPTWWSNLNIIINSCYTKLDDQQEEWATVQH